MVEQEGKIKLAVLKYNALPHLICKRKPALEALLKDMFASSEKGYHESGRPVTLANHLHPCNCSAGNCKTGVENLESTLDRFLGFPSRKLACYGSLRPGHSNFHIVEPIGGNWRSGTICGTTMELHGYPVFTWTEPGETISAEVLAADNLPDHIDRLDAFEGANYKRSLVPVLLDGNLEIAQIYAARNPQSELDLEMNLS